MLTAAPTETLTLKARREGSVSQDSSVVVEVRNLKKSYGQQLAVKDVSFSFHGGEVLGLLGPNGAGKSTVMMMIAGLLAPTSGEVIVDGEEYDGRRLKQRRLFGIVPQEYAIYQELSAINNLMFFGRLYGLRGKNLKARCDEVLDQIGLTDSASRQSATYSGGMKRRLNFGIALIHRPQILILDEPTLGVDPQSRIHLMDCIDRHTADGGGVLYASHYMEEAQSICQRVVILDQGEVIANDSIHNLLAGLAADVFLFVDRITGIGDALKGIARVAAEDGKEPAVVVSGNIRNTATDIRTVSKREPLSTKATTDAPVASEFAWRLKVTLEKLQELGIRVLSVETQQSNLERVFLNLTGKQLRD